MSKHEQERYCFDNCKGLTCPLFRRGDNNPEVCGILRQYAEVVDGKCYKRGY